MIAAFAPATVSNVGCGFDVLGFALDGPGDIVSAEMSGAGVVEIADIIGDDGRLPRDPAHNTAGAAVQALRDALGTTQGIRLTLHKGLPLASGVGSSGASAVAAVVAANELFGRPAPLDVLLQCAMRGEAAGCGTAHADNVAPALYGGFVLVRGYSPPDVVTLPVPPTLTCAVLHPHHEVQTSAARAVLGDTVSLHAAVQQWGNVGALVAALFTSDLLLLGRSLTDHIAEGKRAHLVPGFAAVKEAALQTGALGCSLSGAGPAIFALCASLDAAHRVGDAMSAAYSELASDLWVSPVGAPGARVVSL